MNWFTDLLTNTASIGHILLVYTALISLGLALGRIRIHGISFGVTCVLFVSLIANYLGVTMNASVLDFTKNFGLMLFVFLVGLEVGPSFFSSFKNEGLQLNLVMLLMIFISIALTIALFFIFSDSISLPQILGVHFGAITCTAGLGATQEILTSMNYKGENIAVGYACAYPLSILGVIGSMIFIKYLFKIDSKAEDEMLRQDTRKGNPVEFSIALTNEALNAKTIADIRRIIGKNFICTRLIRDEEHLTPLGDTILVTGDKLRVISEPEDRELIVALFGHENFNVDFAAVDTTPMQSSLIRVTRDEVNGLRLGELLLSHDEGVNIARVYRSGLKLIPHAGLRLQLGDTVYCVGPEASVRRLAEMLGNQVQKLDKPNIVTICLGMLLGIVLGSLPIAIPGMPVALKLGLAGGPLIVAILIAYYGPSLHLLTYTTHSANLMLREFGLSLFLASIGLSAGENFAHAMLSGSGWFYVVLGLLITVIPCVIGGIVARVRYKMNFHLIMGLMAGATTNAPTLAYAATQSDRNTAVIGYSTVYPLATFIRILSGQVILFAMWMYV